MPKFRVAKPYWYTLEAIVEAENEEEAERVFDDTPDLSLTENYHGYLDSYITEIEELKDA